MIEIHCDDEIQMRWMQVVIAYSDHCPFDNTNISCDIDCNCILCVRDNIDWHVKGESR